MRFCLGVNNTARTFTSCVPIESARNIFQPGVMEREDRIDDGTIDVIRCAYAVGEPMPHVGINDVVLARVQLSLTYQLASVVAIKDASEILVTLCRDNDDDDDDTEYVLTRFDVVPWKNGTIYVAPFIVLERARVVLRRDLAIFILFADDRGFL